MVFIFWIWESQVCYTKLTEQASRYWTDLKSMKASRGQEPIESWSDMKDILKKKYVPSYYYDRLLYGWHQISQGNKSAKEYVSEFDEFLNHYNILSKKSDA